MKRIMRIVLVLILAFSVTSMPVYAERDGHEGRGGERFERRGGFEGHGEHFERHGEHGEFGVFVGPGWWGPGPWDPYYPYYPYYSSPPVIVQPPEDLYVQPNAQGDVPDYWYFCQEPQGYYPYVKECPKGWMKVVPPANPPN